MNKQITEAQAREIIKTLCAKFNARPCYVEIHQHLPYGVLAQYHHNRIFLTPKALSIDDVLHEFAHHLVRERKQIREAYQIAKRDYERMKQWDFGFKVRHYRRRQNKRRKVHEREFAMCLKRVVLAYYGSLDKYDWNIERKRVQKLVLGRKA